MPEIVLIVGILSPTFWLATLLKRDANKAKVVRLLNWLYFSVSALSFIGLLLAEKLANINLSGSKQFDYLELLWGAYLLSRSSEIFIAFLRDALDKVAERDSDERGKWWPQGIVDAKNWLVNHQWIATHFNGNKLKNHDRLVLSFRSYFELIANFSILYLLTPLSYWKESRMPSGIWESGYFSGVTITTLGYGDITPAHWFSQFLTVFEVLCGFALIVVCFAIYLQPERKSG